MLKILNEFNHSLSINEKLLPYIGLDRGNHILFLFIQAIGQPIIVQPSSAYLGNFIQSFYQGHRFGFLGPTFQVSFESTIITFACGCYHDLLAYLNYDSLCIWFVFLRTRYVVWFTSVHVLPQTTLPPTLLTETTLRIRDFNPMGRSN